MPNVDPPTATPETLALNGGRKKAHWITVLRFGSAEDEHRSHLEALIEGALSAFHLSMGNTFGITVALDAAAVSEVVRDRRPSMAGECAYAETASIMLAGPRGCRLRTHRPSSAFASRPAVVALRPFARRPSAEWDGATHPYSAISSSVELPSPSRGKGPRVDITRQPAAHYLLFDERGLCRPSLGSSL